MDIRVLVFNSGTFKRAELSKMSEQELWQLWEKDEDQAQVQMYYLDEFSCAFNDEEVSDQDWLYFVDYDNVKGDAVKKQKVGVRIKFDADIVIEGDSLADCRQKWESLPLFSADALDLNVEYGETLLIEDAETYEDLSKDW